MLQTQRRALAAPLRLIRHKQKVSLSTYFPAGTSYFYGYPAGETSDFLNRVPPKTEEIVAARIFSIAGPNVSAVGFASTQTPQIDKNLLDQLDIPHLGAKHSTLFPNEIDISMEGEERNKSIKESLFRLIAPGTLVMAQPFTDKGMDSLYQIPSSVTTWLNDKNNMREYIAEGMLAKRLANYKNGAELAKNYQKLKAPCVIKASSSSSGDGVYVCLTKKDIQAAVKQLKHISGSILVEAYVEAVKNYGVHFGVAESSKPRIDILGVHEQLVSPEGSFVGSVIKSEEFPPELVMARQYILDSVLPKIRQMGWYGLGCFDVLSDKNGQLFFIDCNFRMTGGSAYHLLIKNGTIKPPLISFSGEFIGSREEFEKTILPFAGKNAKYKIMQLIALSKNADTWRFNGAMFYNNDHELTRRANILLAAGIDSEALRQVA